MDRLVEDYGFDFFSFLLLKFRVLCGLVYLFFSRFVFFFVCCGVFTFSFSFV